MRLAQELLAHGNGHRFDTLPGLTREKDRGCTNALKFKIELANMVLRRDPSYAPRITETLHERWERFQMVMQIWNSIWGMGAPFIGAAFGAAI